MLQCPVATVQTPPESDISSFFVIFGLCAAALPEYPSSWAFVLNVPVETDTPVAV